MDFNLAFVPLRPYPFWVPCRDVFHQEDGLGHSVCWESWEFLNLCSPAHRKGCEWDRAPALGWAQASCLPMQALPGHQQPHLLHS